MSAKKFGMRRSLGTAVVAGVVLVTALAASPAYAAGSQKIDGNIDCTNLFIPNIATESTAKGTYVEHAILYTNDTGQQSRVNLGGAATYTDWGWTFWYNHAGDFVAIGNGASGAVAAGSLNRYCTYN